MVIDHEIISTSFSSLPMNHSRRVAKYVHKFWLTALPYSGLPGLSSWRIVIVVWLFLNMPLVCMQFEIVVFPDHTHLLFWYALAS